MRQLALIPDDTLQPLRHFVLTLKGHEQHPAAPHHLVAEERLAAHDRVREIEHHEGLVGAPLAADQTAADLGEQVLHQLRIAVAQIDLAMPVQNRQRQRRLGIVALGLGPHFVEDFPGRSSHRVGLPMLRVVAAPLRVPMPSRRPAAMPAADRRP